MWRYGCRRYLSNSKSVVTEICQAKRTDNRSVISSKASTSANVTQNLDIKKCFKYVKELTLEAGKTFQYGFENEKDIVIKKHMWDLVTEYDTKIEEFLIDGIKKRYPDHVFIGEESLANVEQLPELTDEPTWFIDPIDGTVNYCHGYPQSCISIGLAICKKMVIGVVYNPTYSEFYSALKGQGSFLNDKPIRTAKTTELKKALIELYPFFPELSSKHREIHLNRFKALHVSCQCTRNMGSAALGMAYVAKGAIDCFHMDMLQPWDIAAGLLILREAGGVVIDTKKGDFDLMKPRIIAAATETLALKVRELINDTDLKVLKKMLI